jgi:Bacterial lectin
MYKNKDFKPADGIVFLIQSDPRGASALGEAGGALGFAGISPSLGLEFDIYQNPGDPAANHIGIIVDGNSSEYVECATENTVAAPCVKQFNFPLYSENRTPVYGWLTYDGVSCCPYTRAQPRRNRPRRCCRSK